MRQRPYGLGFCFTSIWASSIVGFEELMLAVVVRRLFTVVGFPVLAALAACQGDQRKEAPPSDFETFVSAYYNRTIWSKPGDARQYYISLLPTEREIDLIYLQYRIGAKLLAAKMRARMEDMSDDEIEKDRASVRQLGEIKEVLVHHDFVRSLKEKAIIREDLVVGSSSLRLENRRVGLDAFAWVNNRWVIIPNVHEAAGIEEDSATQE